MTFTYVSTILFLLFSVSECNPLRKQENENRLATCGTKVASKVWQGAIAEQTDAPWAIFTGFKEGGEESSCTGTIVSPRHIFIATHCFFDLTENGWLDASGFEKKNCNGRQYVIEDQEFLSRIRFESNKKTVRARLNRVMLVNGCARKKVPSGENPHYYYDDFAIIDLLEDLTFSSTLQMACIPRSTSNIALGAQMEFFGFGKDPSVSNTETGILRHEVVEVMPDQKVARHFFMTRNTQEDTIACKGDSGGGAVKKINGRVVLLGILSQTNCENPTERVGKTAKEMHSAVGFYSNEICQMTGICGARDYDRYHKEPGKITYPDGDDSDDENGVSAHSTLFDALVLSLIVFVLMH